MRILMAHNYYLQPGGEDQVFASEAALLERQGHTVVRMVRHNAEIGKMSPVNAARAAIWSSESYREVAAAIRTCGIDLIHFHNTFPLLSPASYYAARAAKIPVVQSLHNYRLLCPGATLYREGGVCERCLERSVPWPGVMHGCYRGSIRQTGVVAGMLTVHRAFGTWRNAVDAYIALTDFARGKFIQGGLPPAKISVKPNFMDVDPGLGSGDGGYALFVGRLTPDKGIDVMLNTWRHLSGALPLKIVGDGPMLKAAIARSSEMSGVAVLGPRSRDQVLQLMKAASVLVFPSLWYEGMPMTIVEAFATGLPVIASDIGSLSSMIENHTNGLHFKAGDPQALASCIRAILNNPESLSAMRRNARSTFERRYSAEGNYAQLMDVYAKAARAAQSN